MTTVSNTLARSLPLAEPDLDAEIHRAFQGTDDVQAAISALLNRLPTRPGGQNFKYIVHTTLLKSGTAGPIKAFAGGLWDEKTDGVYTYHLQDQDLIVTVIWTKI